MTVTEEVKEHSGLRQDGFLINPPTSGNNAKPPSCASCAHVQYHVTSGMFCAIKLPPHLEPNYRSRLVNERFWCAFHTEAR